MRRLSAVALAGVMFVSTSPARRPAPDVLQPNPNTERAGVLNNGVLTVALEAKAAAWYAGGPGRAPQMLEAFSEVGKAALMPGPLVRVPRGTEIRLSVRNSLRTAITFMVPAAVRGVPNAFAMDSVVIAPGAVGELSTRASTPGNFLYAAKAPTPASEQMFYEGALAGAIVVDSSTTAERTRDRVFMIMMTPDSLRVAHATTSDLIAGDVGRLIFTINGRSWPNTERISATVGDSLHWRIINGSADVHPMHLHGFYYRVEKFTGPLVDFDGQGAPGRLVVTERMSPFSAMSMSWLPDRAGSWIMHCHFALHLMPDSVSAAPDDHAMHGMVGLIMGINVTPRPGAQLAGSRVPTRRLRLVASQDKGFPDSASSMRFVLEERGRKFEANAGFSPTINLTRGEPVSITVVNHLAEHTSVHWHGIELEDAYMDGVPGVTGSGQRRSPNIAPRDSFEVRFTPPRSGTFMYHAHANEVKQQGSGLVGALVVRDPGTMPSVDEHVFFLKGSRFGINAEHVLDVNGQENPDTVVLHVGKPARLRIMSLASINPNATVWLTSRPDSSAVNRNDSLVVRWRPLAKDGADLPSAARGERLAHQMVAMGETFDFEYTPTKRGLLRFEVRAANPPPGFGQPGQLLSRVPIRVE